MLSINKEAPDFTLPNQDDENIQLSSFRNNKNIVLYFYPKDDTPGCTIEAQEFTKLTGEFAEQDTKIIGVSKDSCLSHQNFITKFDLDVMLISDESGELCESYGVWQEKEKNGIKKMGIVRSTFIIDKSGTLVDVEYGVKAEGHAQQVLEKIKSL